MRVSLFPPGSGRTGRVAQGNRGPRPGVSPMTTEPIVNGSKRMVSRHIETWHDNQVRVSTPSTAIAYRCLNDVVANACRYLLDSWRGGNLRYNEIPSEQAPLASTLAALVRVLDDHKPSDTGRCWTCQPFLARSRTRGGCFLPRALFQGLAQTDAETLGALRRKAVQADAIDGSDSPDEAGRESVLVRMPERRLHW